MIRRTLFALLLCLGCYASLPSSRAVAAPGQDGLRDRQGQPMRLAAVSSDRTYRSCRRQVRRAIGYVPRVKFRLPRSYPHLIDRCITNGGVYS